MAKPDCNHNVDPLKLVREGTSQEQRAFRALDPAYAPVNERTPAHTMVFAQAYAQFLRYYDGNNLPSGDWQRFFGSDVSVQLAIAAVQDVGHYKTAVKTFFDYLNNREHAGYLLELPKKLGQLFSCIATLARQLDFLKETLPVELPLKGALQNLIQSQLAPGFRRLIYYHKVALANVGLADVAADLQILGVQAVPFGIVLADGLSKDWIMDNSATWNAFRTLAEADTPTYGTAIDLFTADPDLFKRINHLSTHNLLTSVFDRFLKVYARTSADAKGSLEATFTNWDSHHPHYALFLAFLRLHEFARTETNTLTGRHLDFYYNEILQLKPKPAQPGHVHLLLELAKHVADGQLVDHNTLFKAGKDELGKEAFFQNDRDFIANQAKVTALKTVYRHGTEPVGTGANANKQAGRIYASPIANSDDGSGAELTSTDQSWQPFFNKIYKNNSLEEIRMPEADLGFAVASHYLFLAEGTRKITLTFDISGQPLLQFFNADSVTCLLSSEKGWIEKTVAKFNFTPNILILELTLDGADPAVTAYQNKVHGYGFDTELPVLLLKIKHNPAQNYLYRLYQNAVVRQINLTVDVKGLKQLAISNDFGPIDASKPFQPFGSLPADKSSLTIGSKEIFQKTCNALKLQVDWQNTTTPYKKTVNVGFGYLKAGAWIAAASISWQPQSEISLINANLAVIDAPDAGENEVYNLDARHGFARLSLDNDFGQQIYQTDLRDFLISKATGGTGVTDPKDPPAVPVIAAIKADYTATQIITLNSSIDFEHRPARFFHVAPFGQAEQHPVLNPSGTTWLFPQFQFKPEATVVESEAEFYIGVSGLKPPQNLALLFQVADGTADPLATKPVQHLHWSYLRHNEWTPFGVNTVEDTTGQLTRSGIVTLAIPREATNDNTILPRGMHWIRVAVSAKSEAVCRLLMVAAQALRATFSDHHNDPVFPAKILSAGTISKLDVPDAAVKKTDQPFPAFGGRGQEAPDAFYTRVSERLRHKDRAIALWDYERLVLEAFPQIYKVKCLNHTKYEPTESSKGVYRELSPGHVTIVTVPNQQIQNLRDPLRPYTSLGVLLEIEQFLRKRLSCFVRLHVKNPQFEPVRVSFKVRFYPGFDEAFYTKSLREEITRFLSPWAFPGGGSPSFGGKIYKSTLINFVEERPYVDYITNFQLFHHITDFDGVDRRHTDLNEVEASTAVSILVSVPADTALAKDTHDIQVITTAEAQVSKEKCTCEP